MGSLLDRILYAGINRKGCVAVRHSIIEENRKNVILYSAIVVFGMAALLILSAFFDVLVPSRSAYVAAVIIGAALLCVALGPARKHDVLTVVCQYTLIGSLLLFGILLGTVVEPNQASVSFAVLTFVAPLLFTDLPVVIDFVTLTGILVYCIAAKATQTPAMYSFNLSAILPYAVANLILTFFISKMKIERNIFAHEKQVLSEIDQLTGLMNRRRFEQDAEEIANSKKRTIAVCSMDVNGLKVANDTMGHKAGDVLLIEAAKAIESVFGQYGKCYRIGGDEYVALLDGNFPDPAQLMHALDAEAEKHKVNGTVSVSISCGIAAGGSDSVNELILEADKQMYRDKSEYYTTDGRDRRKNLYGISCPTE